MAQVGRDSFTEGIKADMYAYGFNKYDSLPTVHDKVFEVVGSDKAYEQSTLVLDAGSLVEKKPKAKIDFENAMEGFTIRGKNRTFGKGIEFEMELVEDMPKEKIANIVTAYAMQWAERLVQKKEEFAASFFNYGGYTAGHEIFNATITGVVTDPSGNLCYDGKPLFNLSNNLRPLYPGDTAAYYNGIASALSAATLETLFLRMVSTNNVDSRGKKIALRPDTLLVPSALTFTADNILKATNITASPNNDINPMQNIVQKLEWQYLTSTTAWFIGKLGKGLKFHNRKPLTFDFYRDEETGSYKALCMARFGAHVYDWRYWHGSNAATS